MKVNLAEYEHSKQKILDLYNEKGIERAIEIGVASGLPLVVVYSWLNSAGEFDGKIADLVEFYGYTEVK